MYCSASNIIYGTTELCLPFLFDILKNQVNKMVVQYENTYWWIQHSYFYWKVEKQSYICDISFWPQIYHITNMSQLCMWIAFLRWDLNIANPKHAFCTPGRCWSRTQSQSSRWQSLTAGRRWGLVDNIH